MLPRCCPRLNCSERAKMTGQRINKRTVDALKPNGSEFTVWDDTVSGFGVRVRPKGAMSYVVVYRAGVGRGAPVRRYTIGAVHDPAGQRTTERGAKREPRDFTGTSCIGS